MKYSIITTISFVLLAHWVTAQSQDEIRLLVRGDDIGSFTSANHACIDSVKNGIVRSLELMVPCAWLPEAVKLLNENPTIDVGVHLTITSEWTNNKWRPLTHAPSLTDEYGYFYPYIWAKRDEPNRALQETEWKLAEIEAEFRAQIEMAKKCVPHVSHITDHMGCAGWNNEVRAMVQRLAVEYDLYWGNPQTKAFPRMNANSTDPAEKRVAAFIEALGQLEPGNTYMFVEHPAYDTPEMRRVGHLGYEHVAQDRDGVTTIFTDSRVINFIKQKGIRLVSYADVIEEAKIQSTNDTPKPNILWITAEDLSPTLGCYGDAYAVTPNLDRLASQSLRYAHCWSNAPVCAPARTALLMGMYPTALGGHHMRSDAPIPPTLKPYPLLLREAGYFTTNNSKTDYNVIVNLGQIWSQQGNEAHWKNRQPGQPFFAVFNFEITHESRLRDNNNLAANRRSDPATVPIPAYHPDTPEVRRNWAQYYDRIKQLDDQIQLRLDELDEAGLAEDTIVFFFGDHGSGMPRSKRTVLQTGLGTPLIIRIPEKFKHLAPEEYAPNGVSERLVSFVDFAPTLLSLIGEKTPDTMHGKAFAGQYDTGPQPYIFGHRDRMDERYDASRSVRDSRYVLALNLYPHIPYGVHLDYMYQTQTMPAWRKLYDEGKLPPEQAFFFEMKPVVELYDLQTDPDQIHNLAYRGEYEEIRNQLLSVLLIQMRETRDLGFLPEAMFWERAHGSTPYEMGRDLEKYDFDKIANVWLRRVGKLEFTVKPDGLVWSPTPADYITHLFSPDDAVRYWVGVGLLRDLVGTAGQDGTKPSDLTKVFSLLFHTELELLAADESRIVRIPAAEALGRFGTEADVAKAEGILLEMMSDTSAVAFYRTFLAFNSLDTFASRIADPEFKDRVKAAAESITSPAGRTSQTFDRVVQSVLGR